MPSRYADDQDLNDELKERERWNDPAAGFLTVNIHEFIYRWLLIVYYRKSLTKRARVKG